MTPERIDQMTREMHEIVREFSERYGVPFMMCSVFDQEIPPEPIKDSAGSTNMGAEDLNIIGSKIYQLYQLTKRKENVNNLGFITSFSKN